MLSDSAILKHIARQPKRSAGFKQLVRELGLHGDERRDLNERLQKLVASGGLISQLRSLRLTATFHRQEPRRPPPHHAPRRLRFRHSRRSFVSATQVAADWRHLHPPALDRQLYARRPRTGRHRRHSSRRPGRRSHRSPRGAGHLDGGGIFHYGSRHNYVTPIDTKITQEIVIPAGMEVPTKSSASPVPSVFKNFDQRQIHRPCSWR